MQQKIYKHILDEEIKYVIYAITKRGKFIKYLCRTKSGEFIFCFGRSHPFVEFDDWLVATNCVINFSYLPEFEEIGVRKLVRQSYIEER